MTYSIRSVRDGVSARKLAVAHRSFFEESLYRVMKYDPEKAEISFLSMMMDSDFELLVAFTEEDEVAGYSVFAFENPWMAEEVALGVLFYVMPEHRRSQCSQMLVDAETEICQNRGAKLSFTSSTAGFADNGCNEIAYTRLRKRNGFVGLGTFLVREFGNEQS